MLYTAEISDSCERKMIRSNWYLTSKVLNAIDNIVSHPEMGKLLDQNDSIRVYRQQGVRVFYSIDGQTIKVISFSKGIT